MILKQVFFLKKLDEIKWPSSIDILVILESLQIWGGNVKALEDFENEYK